LRAAALLRLVRWPGAVTAAANAMTGFLVAHSHRATTHEEAVAAFGAAAGGAVVYAGGVVLNDVADASRDVAIHPGRPIPSGQVTVAAARTLGLALLVAGAAASMAFAGPWAGAATAAAALCAFAYDFAAKGRRVPGAVVLGLARAANAAAGALAGASAPDLQARAGDELVLWYVAAVFAYTVVLTTASTFEDGEPSKTAAGAFATVLFVAAALPWARFFAAWRAGPVFAYLPLSATLVVAGRDAAEPAGPGMGAVVRAGVFGFVLADSAWLLGTGRYDRGFEMLLGYVALRFILSRARS
jgi:4-hydroxybenzoate polyprenyltransferase